MKVSARGVMTGWYARAINWAVLNVGTTYGIILPKGRAQYPARYTSMRRRLSAWNVVGNILNITSYILEQSHPKAVFFTGKVARLKHYYTPS